MPELRKYEPFMLEKGRDKVLKRVNEAYEHFKETKTFEFPKWLYGEPLGKLFKVEVEDCPRFGDSAWLEFDSARTLFMNVDVQIDFCGKNGYVDVMGYDLSLTSAAIKPIKACLDAIRGTDIKIMHTREGHLPDLSDAPFNKILRSKIIGNGVGIGETPPSGMGRLLIRGEKNWDIVDEIYPEPGDIVVDKAGKGSFLSSTILQQLLQICPPPTHLVLTGVTTDVCVHTVMREANDLGYWCLLLKDCTGATDYSNLEATIKITKMSGGIFGWVSDSTRFIKAIDEYKVRES